MSKRKAVSDFKQYYSILFEGKIDNLSLDLVWMDYLDSLKKADRIKGSVNWKCPVKGR